MEVVAPSQSRVLCQTNTCLSIHNFCFQTNFIHLIALTSPKLVSKFEFQISELSELLGAQCLTLHPTAFFLHLSVSLGVEQRSNKSI